MYLVKVSLSAGFMCLGSKSKMRAYLLWGERRSSKPCRVEGIRVRQKARCKEHGDHCYPRHPRRKMPRAVCRMNSTRGEDRTRSPFPGVPRYGCFGGTESRRARGTRSQAAGLRCEAQREESERGRRKRKRGIIATHLLTNQRVRPRR